MGTNIDLNTESFVFLDSSRFKTTKWCKARITALALLDRTSNSLSCLSSLAETTPMFLNLFFYVNVNPPTCRKHWKRFLERWSTSVLEVMIFITAMSQAVAKPFNACWRPDSEKASKTISSAKNNQPTNLASSDRDTLIGSADLIHPVQVNCKKEK